MDGWEKFEEASLLPKDVFYSKLNMKGISDQDHEHVQGLEYHREKDLGLLSQYLLKNRCFAVGRCI